MEKEAKGETRIRYMNKFFFPFLNQMFQFVPLEIKTLAITLHGSAFFNCFFLPPV
jgi:hypothetical protein